MMVCRRPLQAQAGFSDSAVLPGHLWLSTLQVIFGTLQQSYSTQMHKMLNSPQYHAYGCAVMLVNLLSLGN